MGKKPLIASVVVGVLVSVLGAVAVSQLRKRGIIDPVMAGADRAHTEAGNESSGYRAGRKANRRLEYEY